MKEVTVKLTLTEDILGSQPGDPAIHEKYIASKAPDSKKLEEEVAAMGVEEVVEKTMTYFHRTKTGQPCLLDYMIRGFFKSAAKAINSFTDADVPKLTAYKSKIDTLVFVFGMDGSRFIPLNMPEGSVITTLQRPLRGQTAQGERIALANSEVIPAGTTLEFRVECDNDDLMPYVYAWLNYGRRNGLGQWRNASYGRFTWEVVSGTSKEVMKEFQANLFNAGKKKK